MRPEHPTEAYWGAPVRRPAAVLVQSGQSRVSLLGRLPSERQLATEIRSSSEKQQHPTETPGNGRRLQSD